MLAKESSAKKVNWVVSERLISIDGPDGSGKSTLAVLIANMLRKKVRGSYVKIIRPACFEASALARKVGLEYIKKKNLLVAHSIQDNDFFLRAMENNYSSVILPLVRNNHWVVIDSSEIRALAFMLEKGSFAAVEDTKKRISIGTLVSNMQPSLRIILSGSPVELKKNLETKVTLDMGDPKNEEEIKRRMSVYESAIDFIQKRTNERSRWLKVQIEHSMVSAEAFLEQVVREKIEPTIFDPSSQ